MSYATKIPELPTRPTPRIIRRYFSASTFFPFPLLPVTLRGANHALVQVLCRKHSVKLPLHLKRAHHHPRAVRYRHAHWAAVRGSRLHQPEREVKKRGLQGQRGE